MIGKISLCKKFIICLVTLLMEIKVVVDLQTDQKDYSCL